MVLKEAPICDFGTLAKPFSLLGVDGKIWKLQDCTGEKGTLVMFICNHCPYVKAIQTRLARDTRELIDYGINSVAIMSNDVAEYPEDSFENMRDIAEQFQYSFPYLLDETQEVGHAYEAVCTPDFFGYNAELQLQYRGRFDANRNSPVEGARRDLFEAMKQIANTGQGPADQLSSVGCSIKWR